MRKAEQCNDGVTVRVGGRRVKRTDLLQEQLRTKQREYRELTKANGVLKAKEDMQLSLLDGYETCLHHTALVLQAALNDHDAEERMLPAVMLDIKAFELMQQLTPDSKSLLSTNPMQNSKPQGAAEVSTAPSSLSGATAALSNTVPGRRHSSRAGTCRTARCLAAISTADVRECRSFTAQQLAGRFKDSLARVALVQQMQSSPLGMAAKSLDAAVDGVVRLILLGIIAAEKQYFEALCLNMETLQREDPPDELWPTLVRTIHFTPQQQQQLATAWEVYTQQKGILLQRQKGVVQQLQALLSAQGENPAPLPSGQGEVSVSSTKQVPSDCSSDSRSLQCSDAAGPALLLLEAAEEVERLLSEVLRITHLLTQQLRVVGTFYLNALTTEQHTKLMLNAYPFFISLPKVMECVLQQVHNGRSVQ